MQKLKLPPTWCISNSTLRDATAHTQDVIGNAIRNRMKTEPVYKYRSGNNELRTERKSGYLFSCRKI